MVLSERERRFVEAYMGRSKGNATKAAVAAGYATNSAKVTASRLLSKANVRAAIEARVTSDPQVSDRADRQRFLTTVMHTRKVSMKDRLKAVELLGKSQGDFVKQIAFVNPPAFRLILDDDGRS